MAPPAEALAKAGGRCEMHFEPSTGKEYTKKLKHSILPRKLTTKNVYYKQHISSNHFDHPCNHLDKIHSRETAVPNES